MSARKKLILCFIAASLFPLITASASASAASTPQKQNAKPEDYSLASQSIAAQLGWVESNENYCGGYYLEQPFVYPLKVEKNNMVEVTGEQGLLSQRGTSILEGKVSINRYGQQITSNKAYLYRDPATGKLNAVEMIGNVNLREPNTLVLAKKGRYNFNTQSKSLIDILYRTTLLGNRQIAGSGVVSEQQMQHERKITSLTAWGKASDFSQTEPKVYELADASYTTCPPINPTWQVKASHLELNKNTGRGYATHARILVRNIPVFYTPYINFPIDSRRKTGFLYPKIGASNNWGPYFQAPFYWNMAPNYDMTLTPGLLSKRGVQLLDNFRYLTSTSKGDINFGILPNDRFYSDFQHAAADDVPEYLQIQGNTPDIVEAELNRLQKSSTTRKGLFWRDESQFNEHWSSHVDFSYAGDDYYMRDFGNLNQITDNQLLQEGDLNYKSEHWNFTGRIQTYQTLHPVNAAPVQNQYRRFPQLILNGDYPDQLFGLEYFASSEVTHFEILKTPGTTTVLPLGNRLNLQPGISLPLYWPYFFINPRYQVALTDYNLQQTSDTNTPVSIHRAVPIFDVASGLSFYRNVTLFSQAFHQTLEPQVYYTYIPYRNQASIPTFDTTVNTLTYDQLFNYNRFSGIDRIGDANQIGIGLTTRLIDQDSGFEKVRFGVGDIIYFSDRRVTLCNNTSCSDNPTNPANHYRLSPATAVLDYHVNPLWKLSANTLWNSTNKQIDNSSITVNYKTDDLHIINIGYSFARNGNPFSGLTVNNADNNLKLTDFSFVWPIVRDVSAVGRWTEDWNTSHFQNLLYGLQYDTCCWTVRAVGGRTFTNIENNTPQYTNEFYVQFSLKGFSSIGPDPSKLLSTVAGYNTQMLFG